MRRRWPVVLLLAGALLLLASLYLPWQRISADKTTVQLLNLFSAFDINGWSTPVGSATAVFALLLAGFSATAWLRPHLVPYLPVGICGLLAGCFAIAVGADTRSLAHHPRGEGSRLPYHFAYGAYLGLAATLVILLAAVFLLRPLIARRPSPTQAAALALAVGLLVAFLLPWERLIGLPQYTSLGIAAPAAMVAAALTLFLPPAGVWRRGLAVAAALFTGAAVSATGFEESHVYGAWLGLGFAVALAAVTVPEEARPRLPRSAILPGAVAALFLVALFLPWQEQCVARTTDLGPFAGRCLSANGWDVGVATSGAALLALALVVTIAAPGLLRVSALELASGFGLFAATAGFALISVSAGGVHYRFGYGAIMGFVAAGLLVAIALAQSRPRTFPPIRLAPMAACTGFLVIVVLPWWGVLSPHGDSTLRLGELSWLTLAAALLAIRLATQWWRSQSTELVHLPLAMLALVALVLIEERDGGINWGGGIVVGLCLLLALFGYADRREGIPDFLRVDRL